MHSNPLPCAHNQLQVIGVAEVINKMGEEDVFSKQDEMVGVNVMANASFALAASLNILCMYETFQSLESLF